MYVAPVSGVRIIATVHPFASTIRTRARDVAAPRLLRQLPGRICRPLGQQRPKTGNGWREELMASSPWSMLLWRLQVITKFPRRFGYGG